MKLLGVIALSLLAGCEDTMLNNMVEDKVYLLKEGVQSVNVYNVDQPIIPIEVVKSGVLGRIAKLDLDIKPELLTAYNTTQQKEYKLLDPATYSLKSNTMDMGADDYQKAFELLLDGEKFKAEKAKDPTAILAIPCEVTLLNPNPDEKSIMQAIIIPTLVEPYIQFTKSGVSENDYKITASSLPMLYYYSKVELNYSNLANVNFEVELAKDYQTLIEEYNVIYRTSPEYKEDYVLLPEASYELNHDWTIAYRADYTDIHFQILKDKLVDNSGKARYGMYILPLQITQVSANKIHPDRNVILARFKYE